MSAKRNTYMSGPRAGLPPYNPLPPRVEAAKHLANVARRFAADRATAADVDAAIQIWREACGR